MYKRQHFDPTSLFGHFGAHQEYAHAIQKILRHNPQSALRVKFDATNPQPPGVCQVQYKGVSRRLPALSLGIPQEDGTGAHGKSDGYAHPGIRFHAQITVPKVFSEIMENRGTLELLQNTKFSRQRRSKQSGEMLSGSGGTWQLDGGDPYPASSLTAVWSFENMVILRGGDSPSVPLAEVDASGAVEEYDRVIVHDQFMMYLLLGFVSKSRSKARIPIARIDWSWKAKWENGKVEVLELPPPRTTYDVFFDQPVLRPKANPGAWFSE